MKDYRQEKSWIDSPAWGATLVAIYTVVALSPLVLAYAFSHETHPSFVEEAGKGAALLAFAVLVLQYVLSARIHWIDRPFGLNAVMSFHKAMGIFAGALLCAHPLLLAAEYGGWSLFGIDTSWPVTLGKVALIVLVLSILLALLFKKIGMDYTVWRLCHKGIIVVVVLGFIHSSVIGSDLQSVGMRLYWSILFSLCLVLFFYRNIYIPWWGRQLFRVTEVKRESHDTWTVACDVERKRDTFRHYPGQFWFMKLIRPGRLSEEHPFTLSSSPTREPPYTSTIKESGDFTDTIGETKPGDRISIEGPFGKFSCVHSSAESFIFIAGGVGITPMISMLRYLQDTEDGRPVVLFYGNKTEKDILFREELEKTGENVTVIHVLSQADDEWRGARGYITRARLTHHCDDVRETADVFLCGPPPMMDAVRQSLRDLEIDGTRVHYERFSI